MPETAARSLCRLDARDLPPLTADELQHFVWLASSSAAIPMLTKPQPARSCTAPSPAREAERRRAAAELLRDIAGQYGPRRAHKLRAMADWLTAAPAAKIAREG